jgi:hypothetical protein
MVRKRRGSVESQRRVCGSYTGLWDMLLAYQRMYRGDNGCASQECPKGQGEGCARQFMLLGKVTTSSRAFSIGAPYLADQVHANHPPTLPSPSGPKGRMLTQDSEGVGVGRDIAPHGVALIRHGSPDAPDSVAFKKQDLAYHRRECGGSVRLGYQKGGLWPLSSQKAFRVGCDENHRHLKCVQEIINGVEPRTAVGELNISQNEPKRVVPPNRKRLGFRPRDANDFVAQVFDQCLKVEGNQSLVFDDKDVGGDLGGEFAARLLEELA